MSTALIDTALIDTARPAAIAAGGPSRAALTRIEIRKSLSTRSGWAIMASAAVLAPHWIPFVVLSGGDLSNPPQLLAELGALTGLLILALGVLSTAGEWTRGAVQTTFLTVPRRGRVLTAKTAALAILGAYATAVGTVVSAAILAVWGVPLDLGAVATSIAVTTAGGAAFAVIGVGIGAAVANTPAALAGTYLTLFVTPPLLHSVAPSFVEAVDPRSAIIGLAVGDPSIARLAAITGWLALTLGAGAVLTHRRDVT